MVQCLCLCGGGALLGDLLKVSRSMEREVGLSVLSYSRVLLSIFSILLSYLYVYYGYLYCDCHIRFSVFCVLVVLVYLPSD